MESSALARGALGTASWRSCSRATSDLTYWIPKKISFGREEICTSPSLHHDLPRIRIPAHVREEITSVPRLEPGAGSPGHRPTRAPSAPRPGGRGRSSHRSGTATPYRSPAPTPAGGRGACLRCARSRMNPSTALIGARPFGSSAVERDLDLHRALARRSRATRRTRRGGPGDTCRIDAFWPTAIPPASSSGMRSSAFKRSDTITFATGLPGTTHCPSSTSTSWSTPGSIPRGSRGGLRARGGHGSTSTRRSSCARRAPSWSGPAFFLATRAFSCESVVRAVELAPPDRWRGLGVQIGDERAGGAGEERRRCRRRRSRRSELERSASTAISSSFTPPRQGREARSGCWPSSCSASTDWSRHVEVLRARINGVVLVRRPGLRAFRSTSSTRPEDSAVSQRTASGRRCRAPSHAPRRGGLFSTRPVQIAPRRTLRALLRARPRRDRPRPAGHQNQRQREGAPAAGALRPRAVHQRTSSAREGMTAAAERAGARAASMAMATIPTPTERYVAASLATTP